jgi:hypothetical protein
MTGVVWYIARNGNKVGPFSAAEMRQLATFKLLQPSEQVWTEGLSRWVDASSLAWLFPPKGERRYWLNVGGKTRGPYGTEQIRAALATRQVTLETQACQEGFKTWVPLRQAPEFRGYELPSVTPSVARLSGNLDADEAELHLAGKSGDVLARLISTLQDLKKNYAANDALVETLDKSIEVLRARRAEKAQATD